LELEKMAEKYLLISDLDDTMLGDSEALERFHTFWLAAEDRLSLVYASGRFFETIQRDVETTALPAPVAVIGGVGSEIRSFPDGVLNAHWVDRISSHWSAQKVRQALADEDRLELQPESAQSDFKVSYFFDQASQASLDRLQSKLFDGGVNVHLVYSSQRDLDVLPEGVNKGTAAAFVAHELGYDREHVIVAGNSGNDAKLFEHDFYGIVVANAHDDLKQNATGPKIFLSRAGRADGVREGLRHWMQSNHSKRSQHVGESPPTR